MTAVLTREVHAVLPSGVDDPASPSGGNVYDRHLRDGLRSRGWAVETVEATDFPGEPIGRALPLGRSLLYGLRFAGLSGLALILLPARVLARRAEARLRRATDRIKS